MGYGDLRQALRERPCFGTFLKLPRPEVVAILSRAGFDFLIIDMEHGQISEPEARAAIQACVANDVAAVVRLPDAVAGVVNRLLEAGAVGIQMPKVRAKADAARLRSMMHFPPEGVRSIGISNAWAGYGSVLIPTVIKEANERSVAIGMFETKQIEEPIDDVLGQLEVAFIGPSDLAIELGRPIDHPDVRTHVDKIEAAAHRTNTTLGFSAKTPQEAIELVSRGYRYIALSNDVAMLGGSAKQLVATLKEKMNDARSK
jgi:2-keto-3-deoxy-L-rhamnonate aldolase RhmA